MDFSSSKGIAIFASFCEDVKNHFVFVPITWKLLCGDAISFMGCLLVMTKQALTGTLTCVLTGKLSSPEDSLPPLLCLTLL